MVPNNRHQTVKHFLLGSFYIVWQNRRPLSGKGAKGDEGERCDYLRKLMKKMGWESSFSDLPEAVLTSLCTFDSDPAEQYIFHVYGHRIPIRNDRLAEILLALGDEGYSILLLYYSLQLRDREIASLLGLSRSKIQKDRKILFDELKKRMVE